MTAGDDDNINNNRRRKRGSVASPATVRVARH
jgi:hypothetical protein